MLEYGVAAISAPLESFQGVLSRKIASSKRGKQTKNQPNKEVNNDTYDCQVIEFNGVRIARNCTDYEERFKVIEQHFREIRTKMENYEKQGQTSTLN